jgi:hypothetical protein
MPNRILRDGILTSGKVNVLDWPEEVFYRRLMSVVDDYGRFHGDPELLRPYLYPLKVDRVKVTDISRWIAACVKAGLVAHYRASDNKFYIEVLNFGQQVRALKSKFPHLPASASIREQMPAGANICALYSETETETIFEDGGVATAQTPKASEPKAVDRIKFSEIEGWTGITETDLNDWRAAYPACDIGMQLNQAAVWAKSNPKKRKGNWCRFLTNWLSRAQERGGR